MQCVFGILLMFMGVTTGLLFQDPVVCRFTESNQCYVALGRRLHLPMPLEDGFNLQITDKTNTKRVILKYRKSQSILPTPNPPRWLHVNDNKTMILTSAERSDSGTYTLEPFDANGKSTGNYTLQLNIEGQVSSVKVSYSCLFPEVRKVYCSAEGDNLNFTWTEFPGFNRLENRNRTLVLDKNHIGNITCHVQNHVSQNKYSTELHTCPDFTLVVLSIVCVILIVLSVLAFYVYRKRQGLRNKEATDQDGKDLVYAQATNLPSTKTKTTPIRAQDVEVEYATVASSSNPKNQKKKEDEVQYGELVFNTPESKKSKMPKVQEECVYSQVQHGQ